MTHPLDNPIWTALNSGAAMHAHGTTQVRFVDRSMGFFAGLAAYGATELEQLYAIMEEGMRVILFTPGALDLDDRWTIHNDHELLQLVCESDCPRPLEKEGIRPLGEADVAQMLALTKLTKPGPFLEKTIAFGRYYGYFSEGRLLSMSGSRLSAGPYTEVSAVCTHPDVLGQGIAKQVLPYVLHSIQARGQQPYLHLYPENEPAYRLYRSLGFVPRASLRTYFLEKKNRG
jgi:ribosomal protein S18 acetylase RimI-like enzyme